MRLASRIYEADDIEAAVELCYEADEVPKGLKAARDLPNLLTGT